MAESPALAATSSHPSSQPRLAATTPFDTRAALTLSGLIHDASNLVTTLDLYCDLLDAPGVLSPSCTHYAGELRLIAGGSRRILEKLAATEPWRAPNHFPAAAPSQHTDSMMPVLNFPASFSNSTESSVDRSAARQQLRPVVLAETALTDRLSASPKADPADLAHSAGAFQRISDTAENFARAARWRPFVSPQPITNLSEEVLANHNLLSALAGPGVTVGLSLYDGKCPIPISSDDLTRILVNLIKNAAEAMPQGGHIQIALEEFIDRVTLSISDTGCGIPESALEEIFTAGFTTRIDLQDPVRGSADWATPHRGLGLAIVRSIVAAAGGSVTAANRRDVDVPQHPLVDGQTAISGAVFCLNFPLQR